MPSQESRIEKSKNKGVEIQYHPQNRGSRIKASNNTYKYKIKKGNTIPRIRVENQNHEKFTYVSKTIL